MTTLRATRTWCGAEAFSDRPIGIDAAGRWCEAPADAATEVLAGALLPGVPNLHSHAFQRAMAGLAEHQTQAEDSFWTWREVMYGFAARLTPESLRDIAAMLYLEMLEAGYTSVCEFHYLHHAPDGRPYADPAAMSLALIEAARETGIGLTLLPSLYVAGGFDGRPLGERQRRFGHDVDSYLRLLERLRPLQHERLRVGLCFHSLRAVPEAAMRAVLDAAPHDDAPIHIHIAEQIGEVQDCLALRNARPVEWLLDHFQVDARWTLVHATHIDADEVRRAAASGATVAICTTTEANLGDGVFPLRAWLDAGGQWGVGSDSHISVSPVEELRWLEYGQRLVTRRRNIATRRESPSVGTTLLRHAIACGANATGQRIGAIDPEAGLRADAILLDTSAPELMQRDGARLIDSWIFSGNRALVRDVRVGGEHLVSQGRHRARDAVEARYARALAGLR